MPKSTSQLCRIGNPLVRIRGLRKTYVQKPGPGIGMFRKPHGIEALRSIDLEIPLGGSLALLGESGSGKSTIARCLAGIEPFDSGEIWFGETNLTPLSADERIAACREIQLVFQDSATALNPGFTAAEIVEEPAVIADWGTRAERRDRALELMQQVGLPADSAARRPLEFSGGQRQRLAVARALAMRPRLLIFDEAFSGLDLLTRRQILALMRQLQMQHGLTYLHITHDMRWMKQCAEDVAVIERGEIVFSGAVDEIYVSRDTKEFGSRLRYVRPAKPEFALVEK